MTVTMTQLMRAVRNCFAAGWAEGPWTVADGVLTGPVPLPPGWIAIEGRGAFEVAADGHAEGLPEGTFDGKIWLLEPPEDFLRLREEINAWLARQEEGVGSAAGAAVTRRRESFGAYSTETAYAVAESATGTWESAFAARMAPYRRMFPEVRL